MDKIRKFMKNILYVEDEEVEVKKPVVPERVPETKEVAPPPFITLEKKAQVSPVVEKVVEKIEEKKEEQDREKVVAPSMNKPYVLGDVISPVYGDEKNENTGW